MTTWEQAKERKARADQMADQTCQMGYQTVMEFALFGQDLIELKAQQKGKGNGERDFDTRVKVEFPDMSPKTRSRYMELARHIPLLEQHKPDSQRAALALIKEQQPPKPKAIPAPPPKEEEDMKKNSYSFREVIVSVWPGYVNLSNDDQKALKEALLAISPDILLADNTELLKAETRRYAIHFSKKFREAEEAEEKAERNALPENVRAKVEKAVERAVRIETEKLQRSYHEAVEKGIASQLSERVEHLEQLREKVLSKEKRYDVMLSGIKPIITKDDYRFLLNTLHSDRVPTPDKMDKAFHIVKKLEPYIEAIPT